MMADQTSTLSALEQILVQAQALTLFQKIHLMDKLAEAVQIELKQLSRQQWHDFIDRTAGSLADNPIERPPQGEYEIREPIE